MIAESCKIFRESFWLHFYFKLLDSYDEYGRKSYER
jgi:hypothetical protein